MEAYREFKREADKALEMMRANGLKIEDSDSEDGQPESVGRGGGHGAESDDASDGEDGTGVMTSQLRHFVIQVSRDFLLKSVSLTGRSTSTIQFSSTSLKHQTIRNQRCQDTRLVQPSFLSRPSAHLSSTSARTCS